MVQPKSSVSALRFTKAEVAEMEGILQEHNNALPARDVLTALAEKFSESPGRRGKITVQMKQVWQWFINKRHAIRTKSRPTPSVPTAVKAGPENSVMDFEAKSSWDGAWYDVTRFLSHRYSETSDPEVLVQLADFEPGEHEWLSIKKYVRPRSLPCESTECVVVIPGDLILCFQENKEHSLYFDAHVIGVDRCRHDVRGCRCRFLVLYDHDQFEEIVPLRNICRRPETNYRLQQLHAVKEVAPVDQQKTGMDPATVHDAKMVTTKTNSAKAAGCKNSYRDTSSANKCPSNSTKYGLDEKKAETNGDVQAGNSIITTGSAPITNILITSSVPEVSGQTQNMDEGI